MCDSQAPSTATTLVHLMSDEEFDAEFTCEVAQAQPVTSLRLEAPSWEDRECLWVVAQPVLLELKRPMFYDPPGALATEVVPPAMHAVTAFEQCTSCRAVREPLCQGVHASSKDAAEPNAQPLPLDAEILMEI